MNGIKSDKYDKRFSLLIRERADWTCERCGKAFPEGPGRQQLHCSHLFSRRHFRLRHCPDNAFAHCVSGHRELGENPVIFRNWAVERLGEELVDLLTERTRPFKLTRAQRRDWLAGLYEHMGSELKRLQAARAAGKTGRIEVEAWE